MPRPYTGGVATKPGPPFVEGAYIQLREDRPRGADVEGRAGVPATNMRAPLRNVTYGPGWIDLTLTAEDRARIYVQSFGRYYENRKGNNYDAAFRKGKGPLNDCEGLRGEVAVNFLCGRDPFRDDELLSDERLVQPYAEWAKAREDRRLVDVLGMEVRSTAWRKGALPIHLTGDRDAHKADNTPYVLAVTPAERPPWGPIVTGHRKVDAELAANNIPHFDLTVRLCGYAFKRDARDEHERKDWPDPCHAIPQSELRPLDDIAAGRFLTEGEFYGLLVG